MDRPGVDEMRSLGPLGRLALAVRAGLVLSKCVTEAWGQLAFQWALDAWGVARIAKAAQTDHAGAELLARRPRLDLAAVLARPSAPGTLGAFLADFFRAWKLEPFALRREPQSDVEFFMDRLFHTHDVWHAVVGLGTDLRNELRFLGVLLSQYTSFSAVTALVFGWLQLLGQPGGLRAFLETPDEVLAFYRWGRRSRVSLCFVDWEALLDEPLERVRAMLLADGRPHVGACRSWPAAAIELPTAPRPFTPPEAASAS